MKIKKLLSLFLVICMSVSALFCFTACDKENKPDIPKDLKYSGETVTFLTCNVNSTYESEILPNNYDDETLPAEIPESLNNDLQRRKDAVVAELGVDLQETKLYSPIRIRGEMYDTIVRSRASGVADYDVVVPCLYDAAILATESMFYNLNDIPELQIEAEWWNQKFNKNMTFNGQLYFTIGELGHVNKDNTAALYFNLDYWNKQNLSEDFGGTPYDLVRQGKWTLDVVVEATRAVPLEDKNNDSRINYSDVFGWAGQDDDLWSIFYASGERIAKVGENQQPYISIYNQRSSNLMSKLQDLVQDDTYIRANDYFGEAQWPTLLLEQAFCEGRCLFYNAVVGTIISVGKNMEEHFGVVPEPKADAKQDGYHSMINPWGATCYAIPAFVKQDRLAMIAETLDLMGETSLETTCVSYADILNYMKTRDDDSKDMLNDYILATRDCDIGMVYQWGTLHSLLQEMGQKPKGTFGSEFQKRRLMAEREMKQTIEFFANNR